MDVKPVKHENMKELNKLTLIILSLLGFALAIIALFAWEVSSTLQLLFIAIAVGCIALFSIAVKEDDKED